MPGTGFLVKMVVGGLLCCLLPVAALQAEETGPVEAGETDASGERIRRIEIEGNERTEAIVINQEMVIREGDVFDPEMMELSRQNIMDLGLFRSVEVVNRDTPEGVEIVFQVDEKRFWYLVPVFSRGSDGDITWGARLQMDNLFGLNNELTVRAKRTDLKDTDIQNEETLEFEYLYPRMFGSPYDFYIHYDFDKADIEEQRGNLSGDYLRDKTSWGIRLSKWLSEEGPSKGLRMTFGFRSDDYDHTFLGGDPNLFFDLKVNSLILGLENIDVVDHGTYRSGSRYGIQVELAQEPWGSEQTHSTQYLFFRRYLPINEAKRHNLNFQFQMGYTSSSLFGASTYQITGGTAVRGYQRDSIEGDSYYVANVEYLRPVWNRETLRGAVFIDAGDAFNKFGEFTFRDPKVGVGVGLRWKIRAFVRTDLRLDIAQGLGDDGETRVYAGTRATF